MILIQDYGVSLVPVAFRNFTSLEQHQPSAREKLFLTFSCRTPVGTLRRQSHNLAYGRQYPDGTSEA